MQMLWKSLQKYVTKTLNTINTNVQTKQNHVPSYNFPFVKKYFQKQECIGLGFAIDIFKKTNKNKRKISKKQTNKKQKKQKTKKRKEKTEQARCKHYEYPNLVPTFIQCAPKLK